MEAGAPQRALREFAAALGAITLGSASTGDGGRALTVQQLYEGAALINGATVLRGGCEFHLQASHPGGLRELGTALAAARAAAGDAVAAKREAALQRLASGESLRGAVAPVVERLQTVHGDAVAAGLERAAKAGERAMGLVEDARAVQPGLVAAATLQLATDTITAREASLERAEMPADAMDEQTWAGQRAKEAASLRQQRELVAEAVAVNADRSNVEAARAADEAMTSNFLLLAPPAAKKTAGAAATALRRRPAAQPTAAETPQVRCSAWSPRARAAEAAQGVHSRHPAQQQPQPPPMRRPKAERVVARGASRAAARARARAPTTITTTAAVPPRPRATPPAVGRRTGAEQSTGYPAARIDAISGRGLRKGS